MTIFEAERNALESNLALPKVLSREVSWSKGREHTTQHRKLLTMSRCLLTSYLLNWAIECGDRVHFRFGFMYPLAAYSMQVVNDLDP